MAVKVTLREKPISKNRKSLYLDFYPAVYNHKKGKKTRREFLGMYVYDKPKNHTEKNTKITIKRLLDFHSGFP